MDNTDPSNKPVAQLLFDSGYGSQDGRAKDIVSNPGSGLRSGLDILKNVGLAESICSSNSSGYSTLSEQSQTEDESLKINFTERFLTFKNSSEVASQILFKGYDLARNGIYIKTLQLICVYCQFSIPVEDVKSKPELLISRHTENSPTCEGVLNNTLRIFNYEQESESNALARAANSSNFSESASASAAGASNVVAAANIGRTAEFYPSQSDSRLPVPVHVKSVDGRLATDTVMVRSSGRTKPETPSYPSMQTNTAPPHRDTPPPRSLSPVTTELVPVPKPISRNEEYDTYEGRLASYIDWPMSCPITPEELSRAGFYYTHYSDKTKCPYCMGAIYNWEETDTAFGEHMRHYPHCDYLKYFVYLVFTTPVPEMQRPTQRNNELAESHSVKEVLHLGYSMDLIQSAISKLKSLKKVLCSDSILDQIFETEKTEHRCLLNLDHISVDDTEVSNLEGAVGGLNLNEQNDANVNRSTPTSDFDEELYRSSENLFDSGNFELENNSTKPSESGAISNMETEPTPQEKPTAVVSNSNRVPLDPERAKVQQEYRRLQKSNICNKCGKNPVNILFLPCRHLVTCESCAENIDECLDCNEEIIGTVKVFLT